ncbi:MAG: M14 family zinc carboxypeptidase [bacterium]|nr:M14 family zinc carboxypeptidase [bacterium]
MKRRLKSMLCLLILVMSTCLLSAKQTYATEKKEETHTITYHLNGGINPLGNPGSFITGTAVPLQTPTRKGYTFNGWYTEAGFQHSIREIPATYDKDIQLYAKWSPTIYRIIYKLGGGKNNSKNPSSYTIKSKKITLQAPTRTGYYFTGWFINNKVHNTIEAGSTGTITVTAKWKKYSKKVYIKKNTTIYKTNATKYKLESAVKSQQYLSADIKKGAYTAVMNVRTKKTGYVKTSLITTKKPTTDIVKKTKKLYDYKTMESNLKLLEKTYPQWMDVTTLTKTADKRNVYCVIIGNKKAKKQVIVTSSMHAREYLNTYFIMDMIEQYMNNYQKKSGKINMTYEKLFNEICLYIVPMVNPDGVQISQYGYNGISCKKLRNQVKKMLKGTSYKKWKTNANGVDLNRNFPVDWAKRNKVKKPGSSNYPGKSAASEKETKAIIKLYQSLSNPVASIAYHSMGNLIDWDTAANNKYYSINKKMAKVAKKLTGYSYPSGDLVAGVGGSMGSWVSTGKMNMPNLTIETGSVSCPLPYSVYNRIWKENRYVVESITKLFY